MQEYKKRERERVCVWKGEDAARRGSFANGACRKGLCVCLLPNCGLRIGGEAKLPGLVCWLVLRFLLFGCGHAHTLALIGAHGLEEDGSPLQLETANEPNTQARRNETTHNSKYKSGQGIVFSNRAVARECACACACVCSYGTVSNACLTLFVSTTLRFSNSTL